MIETQVTRATCSIRCGEESGTGWLVTPSLVITAYHCIVDTIENKAPIVLQFEIDGSVKELSATLHAEDESHDICILRLEHDVEVDPIVLSQMLPIEGSSFFVYGYPVAKLSVGHRVKGEVSQVLERPKLKMDLDLQVEPSTVLTDFKGISGAALICGNRCLGVLRLAVDKSLGAISISRVADFLRENSVPIEDATENHPEEDSLVSRSVFVQDFETLVGNVGHGYVFIGGAQGIGKSTFCRTYSPIDEGLTYFANYSFTSDDGKANAMHLAQPEVFYDWLSSQVSSYLTGKAARVSSKSYREIIEGISALLDTLGKHFHSKGKTAVIFIDGLDEVASVGDETLKQFVGVLPTRLPEGIVFVLSAPSYDRLEQTLSSRVGRGSCIIMPELEHGVVRSYCHSQLRVDCCSAEIVGVICERAQGHPLYLHYLIDLANSGIGYGELVELPLINGSIRNYYDVLWSQLQVDAVVVELLAIIARLRWGLQLSAFSDVLTEGERAGFSPALQRIRHLLRPSEAAIYHSSFSDYVTEQTALRDKDVHLRLARHCLAQQTTRYGLLNVIYHCLRAESELQEDYAITYCNQGWVDQCVTDGVDPDTLLSDVGETLTQAVHQGKLVEVARLLLLCQRLQFRYDTLFALSAELTAGALLSLGKTQEALLHVVRYGHLIIDAQETLLLALKLTDVNEFNLALELLDKAEIGLEKVGIVQNQSIDDFLGWYELQLHLFSLKYLAGDTTAKDTLMRFYFYSAKSVSRSIEDEEVRKAVVLDMLSYMLASTLCFEKRYTPVSVIRERVPFDSVEFLQTLLSVIVNYRTYCHNYGVEPDKQLLQSVFADLQVLVEESEGDFTGSNLGAIDSAISLGAPVSFVCSIAKSLDATEQLEPLKFLASDSVSIDESQFVIEMAQLRADSYRDREMLCPASETLTPSTWQNTVESIFRCLAWSDGAARRAKGEGKGVELEVVWAKIKDRVFDQLRFTLAQRADWQDCYALPEAVFPDIYRVLTDLVIEIYPEQISFFLDFVDVQFSTQCGLYSEGFRRILAEVLGSVSKAKLGDDAEDLAFGLLKRWSDFILCNVKNRHELVPELLTIIPMFIQLDAPEPAHQIYQAVLANSMGPTWYKEDQLGLLVDALSAIPSEENIEQGILPSVAGLLEAASGEMTFQRYVRYDKADLIGVLCKRGEYDKAVQYFIRQVCGTNEQMLSDITEGEIDRISPLRGTRFPGGALDEQEAIQRIISSAIPHADWSLCWAIMEVYQFGDKRHLQKTATMYAQLVNQTDDNDIHTAMAKRLEWICDSDLEDGQKTEFLSSFRSALALELSETFLGLLGDSEHKCEIASVGESFQNEEGKESDSEDDSASRESLRDQIMMPGVFGSEGSIGNSKKALKKAERLLTRGNLVAAQGEAIAALENLQRGGWSVWGNLSTDATRALEIIYQTAGSVDAFVKVYAPLILSEKHVETWRRAGHLIDYVGPRATADERTKLVQCTIEHCELLVGDATTQTKKFEFLDEEQANDATSSLIDLLLHSVEHPNWRIRDKAVEMLLWLLEGQPQYISMIVPKTFSMSSDNTPNALCGILDILANSNVSKVWEPLMVSPGFKHILQDCQHIGRISTILRIAKRASSRDLDGAPEIIEHIQSIMLRSLSASQERSDTIEDCPDWCLVAKHQWLELRAMKLATTSLIKAAEAIIQKDCYPLTVEETLELEQLLADRFGGNAMHPQGRWMAKVSYALQVALMPVISEDLFPHMDRIFRPYNPSRLDKLRVDGFISPAINWYKASKNNRGTISPIFGGNLYLDFSERVWVKEERRWRFLRLTAFMYEEGRKIHVPEKFTCFRATEVPVSSNAGWPETCVRVEAWPTFLGSFTPAVPSEVFMQLSHVGLSDFTRGCWRTGRVPEGFGGDFKSEGCYLSINISRLKRLPNLIQLAWIFEVDGQPVCTISNGG